MASYSLNLYPPLNILSHSQQSLKLDSFDSTKHTLFPTHFIQSLSLLFMCQIVNYPYFSLLHTFSQVKHSVVYDLDQPQIFP